MEKKINVSFVYLQLISLKCVNTRKFIIVPLNVYLLVSMRKHRKRALIACSSLLIISGIVFPLLPFMLRWNPTYGAPTLEFPFENPDDIIRLRGFNLLELGSDDPHSGIDLQIENESKIISPCTGTVGIIMSTVHETKGHIMISINIVINIVWGIMIVFEPYSNSTVLHEQQLSLLKVKTGQRLEIGDEIGVLLNGGEFLHIHYTVRKYLKEVCPFDFSSSHAQATFTEVATRTNSTICYP
jgi:hypothetical protein